MTNLEQQATFGTCSLNFTYKGRYPPHKDTPENADYYPTRLNS